MARSESGSRGSHGSHGSQSGSQSSSSPGQSLHGSRIYEAAGAPTNRVRAVGLVARSAVGSALHRVAVIREAVAMVAPRVLERVVSFSCPNESGCRYT